MNLNQLFDFSFAGRREQPALEFQGETSTFGEIDSRTNRLAHLLIARGVVTGDRLCCYLSNSPFMIDLYIACVKTGVIFTPVNILYRDREISYILSDSDPKALVTDQKIDTQVPTWTPAGINPPPSNGPSTCATLRPVEP